MLPINRARAPRCSPAPSDDPTSMSQAQVASCCSSLLQMELQLEVRDSSPKLRQYAARIVHLAQSRLGNAKISLCFTPAFRRGIAQARSHQAFRLEPFESRVDASHRHNTAAILFEFIGNWYTIGFLAKTDHNEKEHQFKLSQIASVRH